MDNEAKQRAVSLADKTIENCQEVINGNKAKAEQHDMFTTELEKQKAYTDASLHRCRRCGDPCPTILPSPPMALLCTKCETLMREHDHGVMWFVDLINEIAGGQKGKAK